MILIPFSGIKGGLVLMFFLYLLHETQNGEKGDTSSTYRTWNGLEANSSMS